MSILKEHINISDIPKRFGGDFEYQHGMQPDLDSMVADLLTWVPPNASLPMGPLKWVNEGKGKRGVIAVGSCEGREKGEKIASLKGRTRERK